MRAIYLAMMASALAFPVRAENSASYACEDFVRDYSSAEKNSSTSSDMPLRFNQIAGFLLGVYHATNDVEFPIEDDRPIYLFEREVLSRCIRTPKARPESVALELVRGNRPNTPTPHAPVVQPYSPDDEVLLSEPTIEYEEMFGFVRLVYRVDNKKDYAIGVSIRCGLYDENELALGQSGGWVNGIPPGQTVVGEGLAQVPRLPARADCRIVRINRQ